MHCHDYASTHTGRDVALYRSGLGAARRVLALCRGCVDGLNAIGMDWQPEHRADPYRADRGAVSGPIARRRVA